MIIVNAIMPRPAIAPRSGEQRKHRAFVAGDPAIDADEPRGRIPQDAAAGIARVRQQQVRDRSRRHQPGDHAGHRGQLQRQRRRPDRARPEQRRQQQLHVDEQEKHEGARERPRR